MDEHDEYDGYRDGFFSLMYVMGFRSKLDRPTLSWKFVFQSFEGDMSAMMGGGDGSGMSQEQMQQMMAQMGGGGAVPPPPPDYWISLF